MRSKVMWITAGTTLAFWLGNIGGCARYQSPDYLEETAAPRAAAPGLSPDTAAAPASSASALAQAAPPANILDRSGWQVMHVDTLAGATSHYPVYFRDCPIPAGYVDVPADADPRVQMDASLALYRCPFVSPMELKALIAQPFKAACDIPLFPLRAIITPPWTTVQTPSSRSDCGSCPVMR